MHEYEIIRFFCRFDGDSLADTPSKQDSILSQLHEEAKKKGSKKSEQAGYQRFASIYLFKRSGFILD